MSGAAGAGVGVRRAHFGAGQQDLYQPAVSLSQTVCPHQRSGMPAFIIVSFQLYEIRRISSSRDESDRRGSQN